MCASKQRVGLEKSAPLRALLRFGASGFERLLHWIDRVELWCKLPALPAMRPSVVHSPPIYDRFYLLATGLVAYVTLAAMQQRGPRLPAVAWLAAAPALLALTWRLTRPAVGLPIVAVHPSALNGLRIAAWGAACWIAARLGPAGRPAFDLAANLGVGAGVVAAHVALARIPAQPGLIQPPRSARSLDAAGFCACFWGVAVALPAARALWPGSNRLLDPLATDYATSVASLASMLVLMASTLRLARLRRLELGALDRARGALALCLTAFTVAVPAALSNIAAPDRTLPLGALFAALACTWAAAAPESARVSSALRGALVVMVIGAPVALTAAVFASRIPELAGPITLAGAALSLAVGLLARALARPLAPEQFRWLAALQGAARACLEPEPRAAITGTLESLQKLEPNVFTRPELWRMDPPEVLSVDVAGYLHTEAGAAPGAVYELAQLEPERMLRREVLAELLVRRPDVRGALAWMDSRDAFGATLVCDESGAIGLLVFPRGTRTRPLTIEEARAARTLADRLSAVLALSSSLERFREREREAIARAERLERDKLALEAFVAEQTRPRDFLVEALAASVRVAAYSAPVRAALDALMRFAALGKDVALIVPPGVDPLKWVCAYHRASPRARGPLVVVEGASSVAREPSHWTQGSDGSAARAWGGTLFVRNVASLPLEAQDALAILLSGRAGQGSLEPFSLLVTLPERPAVLLERRELSRALMQFLVAHPIELPALLERPEDLRALVMDALCRSGVRHAGQPLGIEPRALSLLIDHDWPGNDAELENVLERAARLANGERVGVADLVLAGLPSPAEEAQPGAVSERVRAVRSGAPARAIDAQPPLDEPRLSPRRRRRR